jgi:RNA polymerase sigma factor (sigma-70 family)
MLTEMVTIPRIVGQSSFIEKAYNLLVNLACRLQKKAPSAPESVRAWFCSTLRADAIPPVFVREWLGETVRSHYRVLYSIALGYVRNHPAAEDLVQNSIMKALQGVGRLKDPESVVAWLSVITRNACLEELRRKKRKLEKPVELAEQLPASKAFDESRFDRQRLVLEAINSLSENHALVVRLRFLEDCGVEEIAQRLGIRKNTVEVRLHRAMATLAKKTGLRELRGQCG